jgi:hypothetical protein
MENLSKSFSLLLNKPKAPGKIHIHSVLAEELKKCYVSLALAI